MELLLKKHVDFFVEKVDHLKDFKNPLMEAADGPATRLFLNQVVNRFVSPLIPDDVKKEAHESLDALVEGDYEKMAVELTDIPELIIQKSELSDGVKSILAGVFTTLDGILKEVID